MARSRPRSLVTAVGPAGAFVADTAPLIFRTERNASAAVLDACDPLFDAVERGEVRCLVSAVTVIELLVGPMRLGPAAATATDRFLRQPALGIVPVGDGIARLAAGILARRQLRRLADASIAATAIELGLPLVTADRKVARAGVVPAFLVQDFA